MSRYIRRWSFVEESGFDTGAMGGASRLGGRLDGFELAFDWDIVVERRNLRRVELL
jgi:hypothetical protein